MGPRDMAFKALEMMAAKNIGALPVVNGEAGDKLIGIFSERDYARKVILRGKSSQATPVSELMSSPVTCVSPDDTIERCRELMTTQHIRHLPVLETDQSGRPREHRRRAQGNNQRAEGAHPGLGELYCGCAQLADHELDNLHEQVWHIRLRFQP